MSDLSEQAQRFIEEGLKADNKQKYINDVLEWIPKLKFDRLVEKAFELLKIASRDRENLKSFGTKALDLCFQSLRIQEARKLLVNIFLQDNSFVREFTDKSKSYMDSISDALEKDLSKNDINGASLLIKILFILTAKSEIVSHQLVSRIKLLKRVSEFVMKTHNQQAMTDLFKLGFNLLTHESKRLSVDQLSVDSTLGFFLTLAVNEVQAEANERIKSVGGKLDKIVQELGDFEVSPLLLSSINILMHFEIPPGSVETLAKSDSLTLKFICGLIVLFLMKIEKDLKAVEILLSLLLCAIQLVKKNPLICESMRNILLPDDMDRSQPLTIGTKPYNVVIRSLMETRNEDVKQSLGEYLWYLNDCDAVKMSYYCSYGASAGFLLGKGFSSIPEPKAKDFDQVDLLTGAWKSDAPAIHMTSEEQEVEAKKLAEAIERFQRLR